MGREQREEEDRWALSLQNENPRTQDGWEQEPHPLDLGKI